MRHTLHSNKTLQLGLGLLSGIVFGFLLQKGGATSYDVIIGQLLLEDWTVVKIMLTAVVVGMIGVYWMKSVGWVELKPKPGSIGMTVIGSLIFGVGFALLGYCPGTVVGAVGQGSLDALLGGVIGTLIGAGVFAAAYPFLARTILGWGYFGTITLPGLLDVDPWKVVAPVSMAMCGILGLIEVLGG
ncbi:YeeE/YedE family protein [bacterium]|nr:YeeE/YedE family protein [candidate division CSSED10-310 bacterium]